MWNIIRLFIDRIWFMSKSIKKNRSTETIKELRDKLFQGTYQIIMNDDLENEKLFKEMHRLIMNDDFHKMIQTYLVMKVLST